MKINLAKKIMSILCFAFALNVQAEQKSIDKNQIIVTKTVTAWMQKNKAPGVAVEVYVNGAPHSYYYGYANQETKSPINQNTIFEVGSFTKLFTSLLIAQEVNKGKVKLSDPFAKFAVDLGSANDLLNNITLQNLATHTTGLPFAVPKDITNRAELKKFFSNWRPAAPIGTQWGYSNVNIGLLGYALENITHRNINQLYRQQILQPLGMEPIGILVPKKYQANYAQGYNKDGQAVPHTKISLFPAGSAMKASAQDMLYFLKAAIGLPGIPVEISKAMQLTQTAFADTADMEQGLGWIVYPFDSKYAANLQEPPSEMNMGPIPATQIKKNQQVFNGNALIDKTGATDGFRAYIAVIPAKKSGVVVLANRYVSNGEIIKLGREILFGVK